MRRQGILIIVFAALLVLSFAVYMAVIRPMTAVPEDEGEVLETEPGEELTNNRFSMFGYLDRSEIASITVNNEYGGFTFENDGEGYFYIKGYDSIPFDPELFAVLKNVTSNTLSKRKLGPNLSDEKLEEYGLLEPQASWTVTDLEGNTNTVYVGDRLLTGSGYYCQLEGRRSAYVLGTDVEKTILVPIEKYVTPYLVAGMSQDDYYLTDDFTVYKNGEKLLSMRILAEDEMVNENALAEVRLDYPTDYYPDNTTYFSVIQSFLQLVASGCEKLGASAEDIEAAGLSDPAHMITFMYKGVKFELRFSELTKDGTYYATSNLYPNVIAICDGEAFEYLEYDLLDWVDEFVFQQYITQMKTMTVKTDSVSAEFSFSHSYDDNGETVLHINANGENMSEEDVANFRQYYRSFLAVSIEDYYVNDEDRTLSEEEMKELIS
ncbi:MAG: DUF4340 domain-containing protein, partial [Clostridia bacterium]|nr:DUF4340 domain-containing protein [Clostridia bacterium]